MTQMERSERRLKLEKNYRKITPSARVATMTEASALTSTLFRRLAIFGRFKPKFDACAGRRSSYAPISLSVPLFALLFLSRFQPLPSVLGGGEAAYIRVAHICTRASIIMMTAKHAGALSLGNQKADKLLL